MPKKTDKLSFEDSIAQLNELIEKMEQGQLSLEQSLESFEKGIVLIRECQKRLADAEQKVAILTQQSSGEKLMPYPSQSEKPSSHDS